MNIGKNLVSIFLISRNIFKIIGEPVYLKPHLVKSVIPGKEHEIRKSWIYIKYESDKVVKKKDDWQI